MERQPPRRHRRRLLTPPSRNPPRPGYVRRLLRFTARQVMRLTRTCCTRPRRAPVPTPEPRPLTSEQIAREISEDSMSRYSWTRITRNRIPSISRLATDSSSSDLWLQPRYRPEPPKPAPRQCKPRPVKRTTAISPGDVIDAAAPSSALSVVGQDLGASDISTATPSLPISQRSESAAATSSGMPGNLPSSELSIKPDKSSNLPVLACTDHMSTVVSVGISNSQEYPTTAPASGTSEAIPQRPPLSNSEISVIDPEHPVPRAGSKSEHTDTDTASLITGALSKEQVHQNMNTDVQQIVSTSSTVQKVDTSPLLVDTVLHIPGPEYEIELNSSSSSESMSSQETVIECFSSSRVVQPQTENGMACFQSQVVSGPTDEQGPVSASEQPAQEASTSISIISKEQDQISKETCEAAIQISSTKEGHSKGTMTSGMPYASLATVATQSSAPVLVDTCTEISPIDKEENTGLPTDKLSHQIVDLVQYTIVIPTRGQSSNSLTSQIVNRVEQLLSEVRCLVQDLKCHGYYTSWAENRIVPGSTSARGPLTQYPLPASEQPAEKTSTCTFNIPGEKDQIAKETCEAAIQVSSTKEGQSKGTMTSCMTQVDGSFATASSQSTVPALVETSTQLSPLDHEETLTRLPTDKLSHQIVDLVQNTIIIPTSVQSSNSHSSGIENRAEQLLNEVRHLFQDLKCPSLGEELKVKGNDDQHKNNGLSGSHDVAQELLAALENSSSEENFVDSVEFPSQQSEPSTETRMLNIMDQMKDAMMDISDSGFITNKNRGTKLSVEHYSDSNTVDYTSTVDEKTKDMKLSGSTTESRKVETAVAQDNKYVPKQAAVTKVQRVSSPRKTDPAVHLTEPEGSKVVEEHIAVLGEKCGNEDELLDEAIEHHGLEHKQVSQEQNRVHNEQIIIRKEIDMDLKDYYQITSSDEDLSPHKTSRDIFGHVQVNDNGMKDIADAEMLVTDLVQPGTSSQPEDTENHLTDNVSISSSDGESTSISPKTSREIFGHVNIDGSNTKKTCEESFIESSQSAKTHPVAQWNSGIKDFEREPQNMMQKSNVDAKEQTNVKISQKASRDRFGHVNIDSPKGTSTIKDKGKKSSKDTRSSKRQSNSEFNKCLKELRAALCSDYQEDLSFSRKTSRERFGHVNIDCTSNEKTHRKGLNDPNKGVHHHHSDISCDDAGPSQSGNDPPDKNTKSKSVKFIEGFELPMTSHYGLNDRETHPLKSVLKSTVRISPVKENVIPNEKTHISSESVDQKASSVELPEPENVEQTDSVTTLPGGLQDTSLSDIPGTSFDDDNPLVDDTSSHPETFPEVIMGCDDFAYPGVAVHSISDEEIEFYQENECTNSLLGIGAYGYCQAAKYIRPGGLVIQVAVKLCYNTEDQPTLIREGRFSQYLRPTGLFPEFYGYLYLNLDSRLVVGLVSELFAEGKTLAGLLKNHHISLPATQWINICIQLAKGLRKIHQYQVIVNDLKSNNVLVDVQDQSRPVVKFIDLGLASYKHGVSQYFDPKDMQEAEHIAPEVKKAHASSQYSDIWALGAIFWEIHGKIQIHGLDDVSKLALIALPWGRPSLTTIIELLESIANKIV